MLLLDAVVAQYGVGCTGYKLFTANELVFGLLYAGTSFELPVLLESLAQLASLAFLPPERSARQDVLLVAINRFRYRRLVRPGDRVDMSADVTAVRRGLAWVATSATVGGAPVCDGELVLSAGGDDELSGGPGTPQ